MPRREIKLFVQDDWSGGINLAADAKNVRQNEVVDADNVDLWPYGGFHRRKTVYRLNSTGFPSSGVKPLNIGQYLKDISEEYIVVHIIDASKDTVAVMEADGTWTPLGADTGIWTDVLTGRMRFATMARLTGAAANVPHLYIQRNAEQEAVVYTGGADTGTELAVTFNDDLTTPGDGAMPQARFITTHRGFMWVGYTEESSVVYKNRVRWSHPNEPEDWRTNDYIDVSEGDDGDEITGLASFGDRLLVFKNRSIHVISGFDTETFERVKLTDSYGCVSQEAIAISEFGVAFYDRRHGPMMWDGKQILWMGEKLWPDIYEQVPQAYVAETCMVWFGPRLHVSVPWGENATQPNRTYIYDTRIGKSGAWTRHSYGEGPGLHFRPVASEDMYVVCSAFKLQIEQHEVGTDADWFGIVLSGDLTWSGGFVTATTTIAHQLSVGDLIKIQTVVPDAYNGVFSVQSVPTDTTFTYALYDDPGTYDSRTTGLVEQYFRSSVTTAWFDAGLPGLRKRWRRPTFVFHNNDESVLAVQVWHDFDGLRVVRQFAINTAGISEGMVWGDDWGGTWGGTDPDASVVERGSGLGRAYAIRMKINGPADKRWGLNAIDMRYIPNRVR